MLRVMNLNTIGCRMCVPAGCWAAGSLVLNQFSLFHMNQIEKGQLQETDIDEVGSARQRNLPIG
jgi:hypothetical protein